ncbi:hypothetical protein SAMN03159371_06964 [Variovorax sp. NFACC28]|nr:hypothetical protein SAMN03159371_06964 [Variovorax sp. NFACC28]SEG80867.1 hypothetical protein SAMN03159365_04000 [Variovorax sp. NFACC29]SFD13059.1 hypothetical protein SAMN03159379_04252 [Variovorax sp. NFACC26]SFG15690.1 hypothetical protein SAMN03159447_01998 [Variovorax sp. NFACC27]
MNTTRILLATALLAGAAQALADEADRACGSYRDRFFYYKENCPRERTREDQVDCHNNRLIPAQERHAACIRDYNYRKQGIRNEPQRQRPERY